MKTLLTLLMILVASLPTLAQDVLYAPILITPEDKSASMSGPTNFTWSAVEGATNYDIQITTDVTFTTINTGATDIEVAGHSDTLYTPPANFLDTDTMYFWRVRARSASGTASEWSYIRMFLTGISGIKDRMESNAIRIFPQPVSHTATITFASGQPTQLAASGLEILVFAATGQLADRIRCGGFGLEESIEFYAGKYTAGAYYLVFVAGEKIIGMKEIVISF